VTLKEKLFLGLPTADYFRQLVRNPYNWSRIILASGCQSSVYRVHLRPGLRDPFLQRLPWVSSWASGSSPWSPVGIGGSYWGPP